MIEGRKSVVGIEDDCWGSKGARQRQKEWHRERATGEGSLMRVGKHTQRVFREQADNVMKCSAHSV